MRVKNPLLSSLQLKRKWKETPHLLNYSCHIRMYDMLTCTLHSWSDPRFFLCVCATSFFEDFYIKSFTNGLVPLNKTEQSTSGLEALFRHTKNVRKKHWQTIGKAKGKTKYADIVLKRLYNTVDVASTFESLITHGWTRLKILRNESHYRSWSNSNYQQAIGPRGSVEYKQHILLSDRSSK